MSKLVGKFELGNEGGLAEFMADLSNDQPLTEGPGGILRVDGAGVGWRIWRDLSGALCVTEHTPGECEAVAAAVRQDAEELRATEEQLRELSRQSRELAPESRAWR